MSTQIPCVTDKYKGGYYYLFRPVNINLFFTLYAKEKEVYLLPCQIIHMLEPKTAPDSNRRPQIQMTEAMLAPDRGGGLHSSFFVSRDKLH